MAHREIAGWRTWKWRLARDLAVTAVFLAAASAVFILGDLLLYGRVNW